MNTNGNGRIQAWLTPAMMGAGLMVLIFIAGMQIKLGDRVTSALLQLREHQTVLIQQGLMAPRLMSPRRREAPGP